ncbi:MAG: hypothetical protein LC772_06720 [Chloroflexi bacterium]|nr:hypothetical protein [Chloroflexota bacterium]
MKALIFSNHHVEKILRGEKTETRRLVKDECDTDIVWRWTDELAKCYARPGEQFWVRERFWKSRLNNGFLYNNFICFGDEPPSEYWRKMSPIHMPRSASRLTIEVLSCRVEGLQDGPDGFWGRRWSEWGNLQNPPAVPIVEK